MPCQKIETGHQDVVHDVVMDYYGKRLATASSDATIKIIGLEDGSLSRSSYAHRWVRDVAWAPNLGLPKSTIASASRDEDLLLYGVAKEGDRWEGKDKDDIIIKTKTKKGSRGSAISIKTISLSVNLKIRSRKSKSELANLTTDVFEILIDRSKPFISKSGTLLFKPQPSISTVFRFIIVDPILISDIRDIDGIRIKTKTKKGSRRSAISIKTISLSVNLKIRSRKPKSELANLTTDVFEILIDRSKPFISKSGTLFFKPQPSISTVFRFIIVDPIQISDIRVPIRACCVDVSRCDSSVPVTAAELSSRGSRRNWRVPAVRDESRPLTDLEADRWKLCEKEWLACDVAAQGDVATRGNSGLAAGLYAADMATPDWS
ncbi:hypothetical protein Scep_013594 [Stephania cephalantha]|uniref:Uncharacterized protein n=1 Tax=Stephania cephalantha TaxID=152367 RepID=A0AAP0PAX3_9MAGN